MTYDLRPLRQNTSDWTSRTKSTFYSLIKNGHPLPRLKLLCLTFRQSPDYDVSYSHPEILRTARGSPLNVAHDKIMRDHLEDMGILKKWDADRRYYYERSPLTTRR